jgi:hypothetical protein
MFSHNPRISATTQENFVKAHKALLKLITDETTFNMITKVDFVSKEEGALNQRLEIEIEHPETGGMIQLPKPMNSYHAFLLCPPDKKNSVIEYNFDVIDQDFEKFSYTGVVVIRVKTSEHWSSKSISFKLI